MTHKVKHRTEEVLGPSRSSDHFTGPSFLSSLLSLSGTTFGLRWLSTLEPVELRRLWLKKVDVSSLVIVMERVSHHKISNFLHNVHLCIYLPSFESRSEWTIKRRMGVVHLTSWLVPESKGLSRSTVTSGRVSEQKDRLWMYWPNNVYVRDMRFYGKIYWLGFGPPYSLSRPIRKNFFFFMPKGLWWNGWFS